MCTVTWWRSGKHGDYVVFFNRDEQKSRAPALPPEPGQAPSGGPRYLAPVDPVHRGTWLATNEWGLTVGLLNHYAAEVDHDPAHPVSRGKLVLALAAEASVAAVGKTLGRLALDHYRPFHIVAIDLGSPLRHWTWPGPPTGLFEEPDAAPPLTTSSFETGLVCRRRQERFAEISPTELPGTLEAYHNSTDPEHGAYSVRMRRPDAQTVSLSQITVNQTEIAFDYRPDDIDSLALNPHVRLTLPRTAAPA